MEAPLGCLAAIERDELVGDLAEVGGLGHGCDRRQASIAARSLGLGCGPMSGFDNEAVDKEFFLGGQVRSNFLCYHRRRRSSGPVRASAAPDLRRNALDRVGFCGIF
jgi:hypothetical protein